MPTRSQRQGFPGGPHRRFRLDLGQHAVQRGLVQQASLLNAGRQVGASIGLAVLGTVAWTVVANGARAHAAPARTASWQAAYRHALAAGFDRAFLVAAAIAVLILVFAIAAIRLRRADLDGSIE